MPKTKQPVREVPYVNLPAQYEQERDDVLGCVEDVFSSGNFVGGEAVALLESAIADFVGVGDAIAVNSGTDALTLSAWVLGIGPGDEVIMAPNSFIASPASVVRLGAKPVFADVRDDQNIDPDAVRSAITSRTKAIMPVHLTGRICDMDAIGAIAEEFGLLVIEDAAQSIGSRLNGRQSGAFGNTGCFSTHPLKNLNGAGDGGLITTDDGDAAARLRRLRNHGLIDRDSAGEWGCVSRMDTLQAALLLKRLELLQSVIERRRQNVALYRAELNPAHVFIPLCQDNEFNTFHTFGIQVDERDSLKRYLQDQGIGTAIHYPTPLHLQPAARALGYKKGDFPVTERQAGRILSLPVHQFLDDDDVRHVANTINGFYGAEKAAG